MTEIESCRARQILNSRGEPTVEVMLSSRCEDGVASAPGGASTGRHEVIAFPRTGVAGAIKFFERHVAARLKGIDARKQDEIDAMLHEVDGTENFGRLGGSAAIATSLAAAKLAAAAEGEPLYLYLNPRPPTQMPYPLANLIGGGKHAIGSTDIQEYLCLARTQDSLKAISANAEAFRAVGRRLAKRFPGMPLGRGDEGAWVTQLDNTSALKLLAETCDEITDKLGVECRPGLDFAASSFFVNGKYAYREGKMSGKQQIDFVVELVDRFGLAVVEDPLHEEDFEGFAEITRQVGEKCMVVGDDLYVTRVDRLERGISGKSTNAILIKPNQVGTLTDTRAAVDLARKKRLATVVSHRSGETLDETIAHLAVAFGSYAIKAGAVGGERVAKLNELVRIQEHVRGR